MSSKREYFYYGVIKKYTAIFSSIFSDITIKKRKSDGTEYYTEVPIRFSQKQKDKDINNSYPNIDEKSAGGFSRNSIIIAYEIVDISYDPDRNTSQFNKFEHSGEFSYNRSPYNIVFNVYISSEKLDDALQILEQIAPFFTPSINVKIDEGIFGISNVPIILNSIGTNIDYQGLASDRRTIEFTLIFTMKGWLYRNKNVAKLITQTVFSIGDFDTNELFQTEITKVIPNTATINDDYIIEKEIINYGE